MLAESLLLLAFLLLGYAVQLGRAPGPAARRRPGYLLAGMPSAFHLLVLARVYDVRPTLLNRIVVRTTIPAVTVVVLAVGLFR